MRAEGLSDEEIGARLERAHKAIVDKALEEFRIAAEDDYEMQEQEDPLAGDVDPPGGFYEAPLHPMDAHRESVARKHGD